MPSMRSALPLLALVTACNAGPTEPRGDHWETVASGADHSCALTSTGDVYCWGNNAWGQIGDTVAPAIHSPRRIDGLPAVRDIVAGEHHNCALLVDGRIYCWGVHRFGELGIGVRTVAGANCAEPCSRVPLPVDTDVRFVSIHGGAQGTCGLTSAGEAFCWGVNSLGALGVPNVETCTEFRIECSTSPRRSHQQMRFDRLALGSLHGCGITRSGALVCWGFGISGELGHGSSTSSSTPVDVVTPAPVVAVAAGSFVTCGLAADGSAVCWGANDVGQLGTMAGNRMCVAGDGNEFPCADRPVPLAGGISWQQLSLPRTYFRGTSHACGVSTDGAVYCWGANGQGQLGVQTSGRCEAWSTDRPCAREPVAAGVPAMKRVSVGSEHTCGLTATGGIRCWGSSSFGQVIQAGPPPGR